MARKKTAPVLYEDPGMKSPTPKEWAVVATMDSAQAAGIAQTLRPGSGNVMVVQDTVVYRGFFDDEMAKKAARRLTREGAIVRFGPVSSFGLTSSGDAVNEPAGRRKRNPIEPAAPTCEGDVCRPFTRVAVDPVRYQACLERAKEIGPIRSHEQLYPLFAGQMRTEPHEVVYVAMIDMRGQLIGLEEVARGQRSRVSVRVEDILQSVLIVGPNAFAIAHCHPTGKAKPSEADKHLTRSLQEGARTVMPSIVFLDHLIIGVGEYSYFDPDKRQFRTRKAP